MNKVKLVENKIGILAYGSLVKDPGDEIQSLIIDKIECETPFNVEFARISITRGKAPTLIPVRGFGKKVKAVILVLQANIPHEVIMNMLWRRETHKKDKQLKYVPPKLLTRNSVRIEKISEFQGIENVFYTLIDKNIDGIITPQLLAQYAINSILSDAGDKEKDGIRYLKMIKESGIITELSNEYEKEILNMSNTKTLEEAIIAFDKIRNFNNK